MSPWWKVSIAFIARLVKISSTGDEDTAVYYHHESQKISGDFEGTLHKICTLLEDIIIIADFLGKNRYILTYQTFQYTK